MPYFHFLEISAKKDFAVEIQNQERYSLEGRAVFCQHLRDSANIIGLSLGKLTSRPEWNDENRHFGGRKVT
jgi:hypothetical protein